MKIALISFEYPPETAFGGIGTYMYQVADMMRLRGHDVEVFAGSHERSHTEWVNGIQVHRVQVETRQTFAAAIAPIFANRHQLIRFDVVEGPELGAEAAIATQLVPDIPLVVKLHTPSFLISKINHLSPTYGMHLRRWLGAIRRGQMPVPFPRWQYDAEQDPERHHVLTADEITTPSQSLGRLIQNTWGISESRLCHLPNPYSPSQELLAIPANTHTQTVTFLGRLEARKGVLDLANAIPLILKQCPDTKFRFVGSAWNSPQPGLNMQQYLAKQLRPYRNAVEFWDPVPLDRIPNILTTTDLCVFPSLWENFPNVCLEAMAAARGIVGSSAGGMAEILEAGAGRLVAPQQPQQIAKVVIELLSNPQQRIQLGNQARDRVLTHYTPERLGALQEASYQRAIAHKFRTSAVTAVAKVHN